MQGKGTEEQARIGFILILYILAILILGGVCVVNGW